jgi:hypothetical protein
MIGFDPNRMSFEGDRDKYQAGKRDEDVNMDIFRIWLLIPKKIIPLYRFLANGLIDNPNCKILKNKHIN